MKNIKQLVSVLLTLLLLISSVFCMTASADNTKTADRLRYIPVEIVVQEKSVKVSGYFLNLNTDVTIKDLTDLDIAIYSGEDLLVDGSFGDVDVVLSPLGLDKWTLNFNGEHSLNKGTYSCDDSCYATFSCGFTTTK